MYDVDQKRNTIDRYLHVLSGDVAPLLWVLEHIVQLDLVRLQGLGAVQQELLAPDELVVAVGDHSLGRTISCWPVDIRASKKVHPKVRNHGEGPYLGPRLNYHRGRAAIRH